jgi:xylan 1,4-beta-xylosidase
MLALSSPAQAQAPATVSVDATSAGALLERVWPFYGYDEINYTSLPEGKALLETLVAAHSAPVHVRSHFLLNTGDGTPALKWGSTNVYSEDAAGNPIYSWPLTDGIMDSITSAGAFPFVELGFMPQALSTHPNPYRTSSSSVLDGGAFYPPTDLRKWADLIRAWATHADERYPQVAQSWLWELWNEPDIGYWNGSFDDYAELYDYTEAALHEVLPKAALGGPAVAVVGDGFLKKFLQHCATGSNAVTGAAGTRLDLVTFHAKGGVSVTDDQVELNLGNQLRVHRAGFDAVAAFPQFKHTPIYVTEADPDGCAACPASSTPANAYRNSTAYGAYELAMMKRSLELEAEAGVELRGLLTWAFTFPGTGYFAGYRTLATNGIQLPVLSAFQLLGRLAGARLPLTSTGARPLDDILENGVRDQPDIDGIATLDGDAIQVLVWNYHDELVAVPAAPVQLRVQVPPNFGASARISHLRVDEAHGDAYTVWVSQGMPASPSAAQIGALKRAMAPSLLEPDRDLPLTEGTVAVNFDLPRFGVSLITIVPESGAHNGEAAGTDSTSGKVSGCACRVGPLRDNRDDSPALFALSALALFTHARRKVGAPTAMSAGARFRRKKDANEPQ